MGRGVVARLRTIGRHLSLIKPTCLTHLKGRISSSDGVALSCTLTKVRILLMCLTSTISKRLHLN
ncbi:hypothetical protein E2C01_024766 [Portunus trituberculatus]|uniref:Uncharacterized protein n=1 Tax=Portunus trituberculatus TaxID=210409 RepID=A0A5B7EE41_PORTR|nr:hypothetical protein [Portunus trituberculatus]